MNLVRRVLTTRRAKKALRGMRRDTRKQFAWFTKDEHGLSVYLLFRKEWQFGLRSPKTRQEAIKSFADMVYSLLDQGADRVVPVLSLLSAGDCIDVAAAIIHHEQVDVVMAKF